MSALGRWFAVMHALALVLCAAAAHAQTGVPSSIAEIAFGPQGPWVNFASLDESGGEDETTSGEAPPPPSRDPALRTAGWRTLFGGTALQSETRWGPQTGRPEDRRILPVGLLYHSYVAGPKESRMGLSVLNDPDLGGLWEAALGGRVGLLRRGTQGAIDPQGWQIDLEGAALVRLDPGEPSAPVLATDYRIGVLWTWRRDGTAVKAGYYHLSSHVGDEFLLINPGFVRINYSRDSAIIGVVRDVTANSQVYGEIAYAFAVDGGAEPLEFQFGWQYEQRDRVGRRGSPFAAVNVHLREEVDYGGGVNVLAGWRWRGARSGHVLRVGVQHYNGKSLQYSFFRQSEQFTGVGIWFDY